MMRKEDFTVSDVALPPVSRKLAHWPPRSAMASMVFIARPAPLTGEGGLVGGWSGVDGEGEGGWGYLGCRCCLGL